MLRNFIRVLGLNHFIAMPRVIDSKPQSPEYIAGLRTLMIRE